jgi:serine/threonine protein kinase/formylglycine-generating enzyme required for sulfatase activity
MNEQGIFLAALDIADLAERAAYVKRTCAGDPTLLRQVDALLAAHERTGEFLDVPALRQIAAGASEDRPSLPSLDETQTEYRDIKDEVDLSFLLPSTQPGSLGRLGHYEVQEVIGRGGCGIVLRAFDEILHRLVAIKVMTPEMAATSPARKRFLREARAAASIRHENVVSIHAVEEKPIPFLVMEYIAGQTLQQKLDRKGPLDVSEVVQIGQQIASGLEAAHAIGLIHRDIKPGNILLDKGRDRIKITDFGLARATDDASITQSGVIAGTPLYMSPEQAQGAAIDHRSDLFSLGSVLYVMCSGRPPFRAATTLAVLKRVAEDQPRPIQEIIPEVPEWLISIIAKLLAKKPADRFSSAQEVANLLARCLSGMQHRGRVESLDDVLPMTTKPANAVREPVPSATPVPSESVMPVPDKRPVHSRNRRWVTAAALFLTFFVGLGMTEATGVTNVRGTVIRLFSPDGTLVVEVDDPGVSVSIDGEDMIITGTGAKEIRLKPGQYKVLASKDGKLVSQELVTVTKNGRQVVRVSKEAEPVAVAAKVPASDPIDFAAERQAAEWVLENKGSMEIAVSPDWQWRGYGGYGAPGDAKPLPSEPFVITNLGMANSQVKKESDLERLTRCRYLEILGISGGTIDRQAIDLLTRLPRLKTLTLGDQKNLRTSALPKLGRISTLDRLVITSDMVDDRLEFVRHLPALRTLNIYGPQPPDITLLAEAPQLQTVLLTTPDSVDLDKLAAVQVRHGQLSILVGWMGKYRTVGRDPVHEAAKHLVELGVECFGRNYFAPRTKLLTKADFEDGSVWSFEVRKVPSTVQLSADDREKLKLLDSYHFAAEGQRDADELAKSLSGNHGIASITLTDCDLTDAGLEHLQKLVSLRVINVTKTKVTQGGVERFHRAVPLCGVTSDFEATLPKFMSADAARPKIDGKLLGWHGWPADAPAPAIAPFDAAQAKTHQEAWAKYLGVPVEYTNSLGMKFRLIPPGEFLMGSPPEEIEVALMTVEHDKGWQALIRSEGSQRRVVITEPVYFGVHEVTQAEYEKVMGTTPSFFTATGAGKDAVAGMETTRHPVECVSWNDAVEFCAKLSQREKLKPFHFRAGEIITPLDGTGYRLPTEVEWEFACRAGTTNGYWSGGTDEGFIRAGWSSTNSGSRTHAVGELKANPFGLYDIHGNVWEWVHDEWGPTNYGQLQDQPPLESNSITSASAQRVSRGGSWYHLASLCRSSTRLAHDPTRRDLAIGFRVALPVYGVK